MLENMELSDVFYLTMSIAAVLLTIFGVRFLVTFRNTLIDISKTAETVEKELKVISAEADVVLKKTAQLTDDLNVLTLDIQKKSEKIDTFFDSAKDVGDSFAGVARTVNGLSSNLKKTVADNNETITQTLQWGTVAIELSQRILTVFNKYKKEKRKNDDE